MSDDITWSSATFGEILGWIAYDDRKLTRWEWVKVRFGRPDPRLIATWTKGEVDR